MQIRRRVVPDELPHLSIEHPILQRIYAARGILSNAELDKRLQVLLPFDGLLHIDKATERLERAIREKQRILIVGDFDADGATSSALAVSALKLMGAQQVEFLVPNRFEFGYGLTPALIDVAKNWKPQLIITVDNGIANFDGVAAANQLGMDVLITDHHLPAETLPEAYAIINPNQPGDSFASKSIAGVGVIFYVMLALRRRLSDSQWFETQGIPEPNMAQFLDLVALGTVADVVSLDQNNRILVKQGLARIRQNRCRPGIRALIEVAGRQCETLRESDLGFAVAPRLNAAGRLDDMALGIECLLSEDETKARALASHLDELNVERRKIEADMKEQALQALQQLSTRVEQEHSALPPALCLFDASWHQGVIGILAGRLKERFHRPVIVFAEVSPQELKGSARSVSSINIRDILAEVDKSHPGLIQKFGGHAMAAGLSIAPQALPEFKKNFIDVVAQYLDLEECQGVIWTDGSLPSEALNLDLALLLQEEGPWGQQFPEPVFDGIFEILDQRIVGQCHLKLTLTAQQSQVVFDAIAFNIDPKLWPNYRAKHVHIAYKLDINHFRGNTKLQLIILSIQVSNARCLNQEELSC